MEWADSLDSKSDPKEKKGLCRQLQESARRKEPPRSSKGPVFNQTKTIFVASGTHLMCEEVVQLADIRHLGQHTCVLFSLQLVFKRNRVKDTKVDQILE